MADDNQLQKRIEDLEAELEALQCDDDDQRLDTKPIAHYRQTHRIEGCTCGKAVIVAKWVEVDDDE